MCSHDESTELLRRSAERTMIAIVRVMAARLQDLDPAVEEDSLQQVKMTVTADPAPSADASLEESSEVQSEVTAVAPEPDVNEKQATDQPQPFAPCMYETNMHPEG
jgi:hypothetical protein